MVPITATRLTISPMATMVFGHIAIMATSLTGISVGVAVITGAVLSADMAVIGAGVEDVTEVVILAAGGKAGEEVMAEAEADILAVGGQAVAAVTAVANYCCGVNAPRFFPVLTCEVSFKPFLNSMKHETE